MTTGLFDDESLLRLLGEMIFGASRSINRPDAFDERIVHSRLAPFFYYHGVQAYAQAYRSSAALALQREFVSTWLEKLLDAHGISFRYLKGGFLSRSVYPDPALRPCVDIDILLRAGDAEKVWQLFQAAGWHSAHAYLHAPGKHLPTLRKGAAAVELHTFLFEGGEVENACLWRNLDAGAGEAELTFLHLIYHGVVHHNLSNRWQLLADLGMLLRSGRIDFGRLEHWEREAAHGRNWSGMVLHAFPEFFPEEFRKRVACPDQGLAEGLRFLFFNSSANAKSADSILRYQNATGVGKWRFIRRQLRKRTPSFIGMMYRLSPRGLYWKYPFYLSYDLIRWLAFFLRIRLGGQDERQRLRGIAGRQVFDFLKP